MYQLNKNYFPYFQYKKAKTNKSKGTIFFIHGYAVNSNYHNDFSDQLTNYDYYAVELPGHGITPINKKYKFNTFGFAQAIVDLINKLDLKNIILIGHSMGGGIAIIVSHLIKSRIKKMILVTPMNSKGTTNFINFLFRFNPKTIKQADSFYQIILDTNNKTSLERISNQDKLNLINYHIKYKKVLRKLKYRLFSLSNLLRMLKYEKNIDIKTLLIVCTQDGCINHLKTIKNLTRKNKSIQTYTFTNAGHIPFFEHPQQYYEVIMEFINNN